MANRPAVGRSGRGPFSRDDRGEVLVDASSARVGRFRLRHRTGLRLDSHDVPRRLGAAIERPDRRRMDADPFWQESRGGAGALECGRVRACQRGGLSPLFARADSRQGAGRLGRPVLRVAAGPGLDATDSPASGEALWGERRRLRRVRFSDLDALLQGGAGQHGGADAQRRDPAHLVDAEPARSGARESDDGFDLARSAVPDDRRHCRDRDCVLQPGPGGDGGPG